MRGFFIFSPHSPIITMLVVDPRGQWIHGGFVFFCEENNKSVIYIVMKDKLEKAVEFCRHLRIKYTTPMTGDEIMDQYKRFVGDTQTIGKYHLWNLLYIHGFQKSLHTYRKEDNSRTTAVHYEYDPDLAVL